MNAKTEAAVRKHGENLLSIFTKATERDPVALCRKLRKLEREAAAVGLRMCNGPEYATEQEPDEICERILVKVDSLLGFKAAGVPVFINRDPRGYALKVKSNWMSDEYDHKHGPTIRVLHQDWGGYGIVAPDLTVD